jgi:hypothetical protein
MDRTTYAGVGLLAVLGMLSASGCTVDLSQKKIDELPECLGDSDCSSGQRCRTVNGLGTCVPGCTLPEQCADGRTCIDGACMPGEGEGAEGEGEGEGTEGEGEGTEGEGEGTEGEGEGTEGEGEGTEGEG